MKLVVCVVFDRELNSLLLVEQNPGRGYWFPFDDVKQDENRSLAAKRIANKIAPFNFEPVGVYKFRCCDLLPCLPNVQTYYLLTKGSSTAPVNGANSMNAFWMNLDQMKTAISNYQLLGLEPYYTLKNILERQKTAGWNSILTGQFFEEITLQFIDCIQPDFSNQLANSPHEQLIGSAKYSSKIQERIFQEFYSFTFPSDYMSFDSFREAMENKLSEKEKNRIQGYFREAMENKLSEKEKNRIQGYFRAFDSQQNFYLSYLDYLLGLAALDLGTSHGGAPAEIRCRYIFRFYNTKNTGLMSIDEFRDLHTDVVNLKAGKTNNDGLPYSEIQSVFNSFNLQANNQLVLNDFLNSVGQLKYRGTSVLFRLSTSVSDLLRVFKRYKNLKGQDEVSRLNGSINYELADHCITLKKSGILCQVESLRTMSYSSQFSTTTEATIKQLPRSASAEIFDRRTIATDIQELLRFFEKRDQTKDALMWTPNAFVNLGKTIINLCRDVREIIKVEARCLTVNSPCYILGDLHGNYQDLIAFEKCLWRATPFLSPASFLFLGDYVDRGIHGLEVIIYLLAVKVQCPKKVLLLRGNHEIRKVQQLFTFFKECLEKFGDALGMEVWESINSVFDVLPISAAIDDTILCLHGGIPSPTSCPDDFITTVNGIPVPLIDPELESPLAWEIMWNDPISNDLNLGIQIPIGAKNGFFNNTRRSTGKFFTNEALATFLEKNGFSYVVRAHEVQQVGFKVQLSGRLLTVFSSSHYCGGTNAAATVLVDSSKLRLIKLDTT